MEQNPIQKKMSDNRFWNGVLLLGIGGVMVLDRIVPWLPDWVTSWEMLLIAIGVFVGLKSNFESKGWIIPILIGGIFLVDDVFNWIDLRHFTLPIILIAIGIMFILNPRGRRRGFFGNRNRFFSNQPEDAEITSETYNNTDNIDISSVFGGSKKVLTTKNFQGGNVDCFMGGAELDLSQCDMQQPTTIHLSMTFGGLKIVVPAHWNVQNDVNAIFGGVDDKRKIYPTLDNNKTLILKGTALFGGVEIKSY